VNDILLLGRRSVREIVKLPAATLPGLFIPLFFLAVNIGQVSKTFNSATAPFLQGQSYVAFQVPVSLVFAVSTATSGVALVTDIDLGYFDKLLVAPIRRTSIVFGRLAADFVRGLLSSTLVLLLGVAFGMRIASGPIGGVLIIILAALWGVAYAGIGQVIALKTRNVQTTNASFILFFPLLFLTPNFVPFELLAEPMQTLARFNPVSYVIEGLRALILEGFVWSKVLACVAVIVVSGTVLTYASLRALINYDKG
jgi:ABC-2 type transport system permease protein